MRELLVSFVVIILSALAYAEIASTAYVDSQTAARLKTAGDQSVSGVKTYNESPIIPTPVMPE